jgi:hypothetical protein
MVQDRTNPAKKIKLSEVLLFRNSNPRCPIIRYELYYASTKAITQVKGSPDGCGKGCYTPYVVLNAGVKDTYRIRIKVTAEGGRVYYSTYINIVKTCTHYAAKY